MKQISWIAFPNDQELGFDFGFRYDSILSWEEAYLGSESCKKEILLRDLGFNGESLVNRGT